MLSVRLCQQQPIGPGEQDYTYENMGLLGFVVATRIVFEGIMGGKVKEEK